MSHPRSIAVTVAGAVLYRGAHSDITLDLMLERYPDMSRDDRSLATELSYGVLRNLGRLDYIIGKFSNRPLPNLDTDVLNILRVGMYQLEFLDRIPPYAAVNESVRLAGEFGKRSAGGFVNGVLRAYLRKKGGVSYPDRKQDPAGFISTYHSLPPWLAGRLIEWFGTEGAMITAECLRRRPPLTLRVNRLRLDRNQFMERYKETAGEMLSGRLSPDAVIALGAGSILKSSSFMDGLFSIQDEASQMVTHLLGLSCGMTLLDLCAAPGGKATHAAELMDDRGRVICVEQSRGRSALLRGNVHRLSLESIRVTCADARRIPLALGTLFDRVLVDPPCSALGVLRRNPEIKWRLSERDIGDMQNIQAAILEEASGFVAPDGALVYSVCTFNPDEGRKIVDAFLSRHPEFFLDSPGKYLPRETDRFFDGPYLLTTPDRIDTNDTCGPDGFFAARMTRKPG
ncbi:MAG: 16S rRNA (cytosine(967)-C(5))-methyltransferase RsmB [Deltaproteobacteria bacterium]|nr:16S rRNA (cytosine(967)-C(5))-methyltransferase RsmB [Candidatus Zymogenaceae bacterium]